jgi:hypothetical protein
VRALDRKSEFTLFATSGLAIVGCIGALCNEYTGVWLLGFVSSSLFARRIFGDKLQIARHAAIAAAILSGWLIAVLAKGNSMRMGGLKGAGNLGHSLVQGLKVSLVDLGHFICEPVIIGWLLVVIAVTLVQSEPGGPGNSRRKPLALGVAAVCLGCAYFEYFTHEYSTGIRLVERAQNQAFILILFGLTLSASLLARAYDSRLHALIAPMRGLFELDSWRLPAVLTVAMAILIGLSPTAALLRTEATSLYPYWRESVERDRLLSTNPEKVVTVHRHRWTPKLLMTADMNVAVGCVAGYYRKAQVNVIDPQVDDR